MYPQPKEHFPGARLVEWKSGGDSHLIIHVTTGSFWKKHQLCLIDLDFECLVSNLEVPSSEQWSVLLEEDFDAKLQFLACLDR